MTRIAVFDYGVGNLRSVANALAHIGCEPVVSDDPVELGMCDRAILPGVGAFAYGMAALQARGLDAAVLDFASRKKPLLGICLGMQMLGVSSTEFGFTPGLALVEGRVDRLEAPVGAPGPWRLPNVGWLPLRATGRAQGFGARLLSEIGAGETFYFVHSFALPADASTTAANAWYAGTEFASVVVRDNIVGTQFHPEKSGPAGLKFLRNFCVMDPE